MKHLSDFSHKRKLSYEKFERRSAIKLRQLANRFDLMEDYNTLIEMRSLIKVIFAKNALYRHSIDKEKEVY